MGVAIGLLKQLTWMFLKLIFILIRTLWWIVSLRYFKIIANHRQGSYSQTAHVQKIIMRHKFDHMIQPASSGNFLTVHSGFEDPDYVKRRNVSLYCLTKHEAVFVECKENVDVTKSNVSSFLRIAQFKQAINVITLPMHVFLQLGDKIGQYSGNLIFIANTGRCGSTLLTQVFEETQQCVAISEPDAMNNLNLLTKHFHPDKMDEILKATVNILCKTPEPHITSYALKLAQTNIQLIPHFARIFPSARFVFMYRDGLTVAKSVTKTIIGTPLANTLVKMAKSCTFIKMGRLICDKASLPVGDFDQFDSLYSPMFVGTIMWASGLRQYLDFRKNGINIAAIRYEDIVSDTDYAMQQIFDWCDLEYNQCAINVAFSRDSQRDSPISQSKLRRLDDEEITEVVRQQTDYACKVFNVPSIYKMYIADKTISYRGITDNLNEASGEGLGELAYTMDRVEVHRLQSSRTCVCHLNGDSSEEDKHEDSSPLMQSYVEMPCTCNRQLEYSVHCNDNKSFVNDESISNTCGTYLLDENSQRTNSNVSSPDVRALPIDYVRMSDLKNYAHHKSMKTGNTKYNDSDCLKGFYKYDDYNADKLSLADQGYNTESISSNDSLNDDDAAQHAAIPDCFKNNFKEISLQRHYKNTVKNTVKTHCDIDCKKVPLGADFQCSVDVNVHV